jgi:hypothetical protein
VPIGLATNPLCRLSQATTEVGAGFGSEVSALLPSHNELTVWRILSQALAPLQSFTNASPQVRRLHGSIPLAPSEVLSPIAFSQPQRATLTRRDPNSTGYVALTGFRTLSAPCSLCDLPGLFHPGSTFGVHPSRHIPSSSAVRSLNRRNPRAVGPPIPKYRKAPLQGVAHWKESRSPNSTD